MKKNHRSAAVQQIHALLDQGDVLSARLLAVTLASERPDSEEGREAAEVLARLQTPRFAYAITVLGAVVMVLLILRALGFR